MPQENLLGERGRGYAQFLQILDEGRIAIAALATGLAQGCVDECVRYAGPREAFGRRLEHHQAIQFTVADMETRVHAARLAWYDAAAQPMAGQRVKKESAIAKLTASNAAMDNARAATQVFGGYGFMNESRSDVSTATRRSWRSARGPRRYSGCSWPGNSALGKYSKVV